MINIPPLDPKDHKTPPSCGKESPGERVLKDGLALIKNAISVDIIEQASVAVKKQFESSLKQAGGHQALKIGIAEGYKEIVQRKPGRFDVQIDPAKVPLMQWMIGQSGDQTHWQETITPLLGTNPKVLFYGALVIMPGAEAHPWHTDGPHLFDHLDEDHPPLPHLPPHCINIFMPLTQQNKETGRIEICPASHRLTAGLPSLAYNHMDNKNKLGFEGTTRFIDCTQGDMIIFDYRLLHQAEPNRSTEPRITLYATCSTSWFIDNINFPERSLSERPNIQ